MNTQVAGVQLGVAQAGIKKADHDDLVVIALAPGTRTSALFTRNAFRAAPVQLAEAHLVLAEALKQVDPNDKAALRQAIASTSINAATGNISFNKLGEVKKSVQVQVVRDGGWHHYAVISDPVLLAPPEE